MTHTSASSPKQPESPKPQPPTVVTTAPKSDGGDGQDEAEARSVRRGWLVREGAPVRAGVHCAIEGPRPAPSLAGVTPRVNRSKRLPTNSAATPLPRSSIVIESSPPVLPAETKEGWRPVSQGVCEQVRRMRSNAWTSTTARRSSGTSIPTFVLPSKTALTISARRSRTSISMGEMRSESASRRERSRRFSTSSKRRFDCCDSIRRSSARCSGESSCSRSSSVRTAP